MSPFESQISPESAIEGDPEAQTLHFQSEFSSEHDRDESVFPTYWNNTKKNQILLEGFVEASDEDNLTRTKSLTDDDLEDLKGCVDLGFAFCYDEIPELCNTLPALELCYSMNQKFMDEHQKVPENPLPESMDSVSGPIPNWKISSPGKPFCSILNLNIACKIEKEFLFVWLTVLQFMNFLFRLSMIQFEIVLCSGDHPEDVKARLKYWAQAVACTVRLCN